MTLAELWQDGPPVMLRDLIAASGLSRSTVRAEVAAGQLRATQRPLRNAAYRAYRIDRVDARRWLRQIGVASLPKAPIPSNTV